MPVLSNRRHELFAQAVALGVDPTKAYIQAGYEDTPSASANSFRLIADDRITKRVAELHEEAAAHAGVTIQRVIRELARIGFYDVRRAVRWGAAELRPGVGKRKGLVTTDLVLTPSDELDDDTAAAISEVRQTQQGAIVIKFCDKQAALVNLGRYLGVFNDKLEVTHKRSLEELVRESYELGRKRDEERLALERQAGPVIDGEAREVQAQGRDAAE